jgi:hypothetical protein
MLVYGDRVELAEPPQRLDRIGGDLARVARMQPGIDRHSRLVAALIDAGQLLQGVADGELPGEQALGAFVHGLAHCVLRSWDSGFADIGELPAVPRAVGRERVELRVPEGFAFYAVYPEAYAIAARRLSLSGPPRVIGIRSIGTTLGAMVAAALDARPAITVRPFGDPFQRQLNLPCEAIEPDAHYVIVDEGPGLSGSSFGAVADSLEARGVPLDRIAFIPSHAGESGPRASDAHRQRWRRAQRVPADFGGRLLELVHSWAGDRLRPDDQLKFAGLGEIGACKFEIARTLHAVGFTPEPAALVHGFIVERGCHGSQHLPRHEKPIADIARYIAARAELLPADPLCGASIAELIEMTRRNVTLAFSEGAAESLDLPDAGQLEGRVHRVCTDNRLDRGNWLRGTDGRLIKAQAVDQGHNLIGCQDPAWDVAGAIAEFGLNRGESKALIRLVERGGCVVDRELLRFYRTAYPAFRLGEATLAQTADAVRYAGILSDLLQHVCNGTPQESSVG